MKKISLVFVALFSVGFLMAQNSTTLTQTGGNQHATIGQSGANTAVVTQSTDDGMAQRANVSQTGSSSITITQTETGAATNGVSIPVQTADVYQNGANNKGTISQTESGSGDKYLSRVKLDQLNGDNNTATQTTNAPQSNSGLAVIGYQFGSTNTLTQNITSGHTEYFMAEQRGDKNTATQTGSGSAADGTIYQQGNSNTATQILAGANNGYDRTGMLIRQIGYKNTATQDFWGSGYNAGNSGETYQLGSNNTANQSGDGHHFTSIVTQNGDLNTATVNQNGTASPLLYDNSVELYQFANGNTANITQELGSSNTLKLYQTGAGFATLGQSGNQNVVKGLTTGTFNASWAKFSGSKLDVEQTGKLNSLAMEADGIVDVIQNNNATAAALGNKIEFSQVGGGTSNLSQTDGDVNLVKLTKTGGGTADITQTGNTNKIAQFDNVFGVAALVNGAAMFNGADLEVTQNGDGNLLHLNSTSAGAIVDVMQNGMANKASVTQN